MNSSEAEEFLSKEVAERKFILESVKNLEGNWELRISTRRDKGSNLWDQLEAIKADITLAGKYQDTSNNGFVESPSDFATGPVNSDSSKMRAQYRDFSIAGLGDFQGLVRSAEGMTASELIVAMASDPQLALAFGISEIGGSILRPIVNSVAKVADEMLKQIDCTSQGLGVGSGCSGASSYQDYRGSIMSGEAKPYPMTTVIFDVFGMIPVLQGAGTAAEVAAKSAATVIDTLKIAGGAVEKNAAKLGANFAEMGFGSEAGHILIYEGEQAVKGAAIATSTAESMAAFGAEVGPKFNEFSSTAVNLQFRSIDELRSAQGVIERSSPSLKATGVQDASAINKAVTALGRQPEYREGTSVISFMATDFDSFVRVHGRDNQARSWMMRPQDVEGLSAKQIAEKFNLPEVPTRISRVDIPPGTPLRAGQVGRNIWGNSEGAIQSNKFFYFIRCCFDIFS